MRVKAERFEGKRKPRRITKALEVPYCRLCIHHIRLHDSTVLLLFGLLFGTAIASIVFWAAGGASKSLLVGCTGLAASVAIFISSRRDARAAMKSTCACGSVAVTYDSWHGSTHVILFESETYHDRFLVLNSEKLRQLPDSYWARWTISYCNFRGNVSERTIRITKVLPKSGYVVAWCELRNDQRTFKLSYIVEAVDVDTKERIDPEEWLGKYAAMCRERAAAPASKENGRKLKIRRQHVHKPP